MRIFASVLFVAAALADDRDKPLKKYTVNLDLAPEDRWTELVSDHKNYIKAMVQVLKLMFRGDTVQKFLDSAVVSDEHRREMESTAKVAGVTYEHALMANYFYELSDVIAADSSIEVPEEWRDVATRSCTGIVAQSSNGTVFHARNQDYPPPFSPLQYDGTFMKDGKVLFEATSFAGIIGIGGTCMVPGNWSSEINARSSGKPSPDEAIESVSKGNPGFPMLQRLACERGGDFESAVNYISETPMILPGYITMAGAKPGEGAVVTRNASGLDTDVLRLESGFPADNPWFLVETNYDHWIQAPDSDDRRDSAITLMEAIGPDRVNLDTLWSVMSDDGKSTSSKRGVYNSATIHTELIVPAAGEYHTYLRHNIISEMTV